MKLIIVQPYMNQRGGAERVILKIAQHYDARLYFLEYNKEATFPEFQDLDVNIIGRKVPLSSMLPYRASQGLRYGYNFYNLKLKDDYDVINAHVSPSEWIRHKNKRVLWYCHTPPREVYDLYAERMKGRSASEKIIYGSMAKVYKLVSGKIVKNLEAVASNSGNTHDRLLKYMNLESTVINPGLDVDKYYDEGDEKYFFCSSRFLPNKRQDYLITAFKQFVKKAGNEKYKLILAGSLTKDKEHHKYFEKLKGMANGNVVLKPNIPDKELFSLYARCTCVLFAAINEDFGFIPVEAMSSSKPIISVNEGGPKETIKDGKTGYLVESPADMAEKMQYLTEHPDVAEALGREGRRVAEKEHTWEAFFKRFDLVLDKVSKQQEPANGPRKGAR